MQRDRLHAGLDHLALRLEPLRDAQSFAQGLDRLVDQEARRVGRYLEENAARLAEVDGVEVGSVLHGRHTDVPSQLLLPVQLRGIIAGAEGDVMHRTRSHTSWLRVLIYNDVQNAAPCIAVRGVARAVSLFAELAIAHQAQQRLRACKA